MFAASKTSRAGLLLGMLLAACFDAGSSTTSTEPALRFEMPEKGRLTLSRSDLAGRDSILVVLPLRDEGRERERTARVVSGDGRRLDRRIEAEPDDATRFRLTLATSFLEVGRYLIEVDAVVRHPVDLRRYVLEITE